MTPTAASTRGFYGYTCDAFAGVVSAFVLAVALMHAGSFLVLFAYLASIPLFVTGLSAGAMPCLFASLCGAAGLFATAPVPFGIFFVLADAVPAVLLSFLAMRRTTVPNGGVQWGSEGSLLSALALYPCAVFLTVFALTLHDGGGLQAITLEALDQAGDQVAALLRDNGQNVTPETTATLHRYFEICARLMPSLIMYAWAFSTGIALTTAQGFALYRKWNLRPPFALAHIRAANWIVIAALACAAAAMFAPAPYGYAGLNLALVLALPSFFVGLAIVHAWAARTRMPTLTLVVFYCVMSIIIYLAPLVALLGVVDQWVDFRKRFAAGAKKEGIKS